MNLLCKLFAGSYENLWKAIIRPERDKYSSNDLGPYKFELNSKNYKRTDLIIQNKRNHKLKCSFWEPFDEEREYDLLPCVIYLHGNSSSRLEALGQLKHLLPLNITVFAFDFSGCGKSEGDYISLGWFESDDVECVVNYLKKTNKVSTIGLWGRSMGAVTSLFYASREDNYLSAMILDSAFYSLKQLIGELIEQNINMPNFIINSMVDTLRKTIIEKANFDIMDIEPYVFAKICNIPAYFCHAKSDSLINSHHCNDLYNIYPGEKKIYLLKGDHNTPRNKDFKNDASLFLYHNLNLNDLKNNSTLENNFRFRSINNDSIRYFKNKNDSYKIKTKINLDNNSSNDSSLKDNVSEKNGKENLNFTNKSIQSYLQKCSSNDLDKINNENKKIINISETITFYNQYHKNNSEKKRCDRKLKPSDLNNIKKLKTSSSSLNIYFKKNIHNPFSKCSEKIKPLVNNCNILNDMQLIKNKIIHNKRYSNENNILPNILKTTNNKERKIEQFIKNENENKTINNYDNIYRKSSNNRKKISQSNHIKNPFLFKISKIKNTENEKQQKRDYKNKVTNSLNFQNNDEQKKWVIFEGINPYLKENKDYFKNKKIKKEILEDENTIKNDDTFLEYNEKNFGINLAKK